MLSFTERGMVKGYLGSFNEYFPISEKEYFEDLACMGVHTREPQHKFLANRYTITYERDQNPIKLGGYCDTAEFKAHYDPRIQFNNNLHKLSSAIQIKQTLSDFSG